MTPNSVEEHGDGLPLLPSLVTAKSPEGVMKFLSAKGTTLLIKGYAGAGKTTLALQMLAQLSGGGKGVYISSRVAEGKLLRQIPWLKGFTKTMEKTEFIDVRLGTAKSLLAEILEILVSGGRSSGVKTVVLDTWDGLAKEMEEKGRLKAEKTLIALADSTKARMVFVSEEPGKTTMDYLVDGIIELVRAEEYGRIFREIEIQKLRGTLISQHKYLYTLLEGRFRHFEPYSPSVHLEGKWHKPMEDHDDTFSFGSLAMDQKFVGLAKGSTSAVEYIENVPYSALRLVELPVIVNALNLGRGVVLIPFPGSGIENLTEALRKATSEETVRQRLAITTLRDSPTLKPPFYGIGLQDPLKAGQRLVELVESVRGRSKKDGVLVVGSIGTLEAAFASNLDLLLEQISLLVSDIQVRSIDALLLFMPNTSHIRERLIAMSLEHMRLFVKDRSVVLMGEKPSTEAMVLEQSPNTPNLPELTGIV